MYDYKKYWNSQGKIPVNRNKLFSQTNFILQHLQNEKFDSVLDVGAGDGRICSEVLKQHKIQKYHAIDISNDRLKMLKKETKSVKTTCINFLELRLTDNYDLGLAIEICLHVKPHHIRDFIIKMKRHCKIIMIVDFMPLPKLTKLKMKPHCFEHNFQTIMFPSKLFRLNDQTAMRVKSIEK